MDYSTGNGAHVSNTRSPLGDRPIVGIRNCIKKCVTGGLVVSGYERMLFEAAGVEYTPNAEQATSYASLDTLFVIS